ncbi:hypothetical protein TVAG_123890 [Trichomonas vaginalis G3]|uniref:Uncharacterized protein n=1 Tax=Trichomonas vaginalis (strain ATCC PRA-98 / G3) TaxID=412133 RepID=A2EMY1_TRIV3|nr:cilia- and flagella-associated protein 58-related family [Trichomonas vaginalis G3]EAY05966.1 hypothetical protein TVAG_123890 [Trichomonas vaginalis G3]KAI5511995.1 cilia- and flagella-associated protein 58-related family [Trichomonas vaginalis G3]|eukprot:XP_001318189.1 hypothetical protein [Trichomonas vaginalis G3]
MSEKKQVNQEDLEKEISQIVQDFQNIVGEITDTTNIRQFTNIYRQLHSLLMDSHDKNNKLTATAQALNAEIIANATKVSALLKMSEDDHKAIDKYKDEFEKARKLVVSSQEKEMKSKEICEQMKTQVDKLAAEVHEQSVSEAKYADMKVDLTNFKDEQQRNEKEINVLQQEIEKLKGLIAQCNVSLESTRTESQALEESIEIETAELDKLKEAKIQYYNQIESNKTQNDQATDESNGIIRKISQTKTNIDELSRDLESQRSKLNEAKNDCNISVIKKRDRQASLDIVLNHQNQITESIERVKDTINSHQRTIDSEKVRVKGIDSAIEESKQSLSEITEYKDKLSKEVKQAGREKKTNVDDIINVTRNYTIQDSNIKTASRKVDSNQRNIQNVKLKIDIEKGTTKELRDMSNLVEIQVNGEKRDIEDLNSYAHSLEQEVKLYMKQAGESIVNTVRFTDNLNMTRAEIESSNYLLHSIEVQSKDHEKIVQNMRKERDIISNQIIGIEKENDELHKKIDGQHEEIQKLKNLAQEKTSDCIKEHFKSRSLEKQNISLAEMAELTKKMTQEMNSTVIKYKSEATKLNLIIMESEKDITHASAELKNISDVITMLKSQLAERQTEIDTQKVKVSSLMYELDHKGFNFSENQKKYKEMEAEMSALMDKNRKLKERAEVLTSLTVEKISLDSAILHEREIRNRYEQELMRPLNVHRWTIMQAMNPEGYKQIQMMQYLKSKLEAVERQKVSLFEKKKKIIDEIEKVKTRAKNARFIDEDVAFDNIKNSLKKKDEEMEEMKKETETVKGQVETLKSMIAELRDRLKETKTKSLAIKQKNQSLNGPQVPVLPINMKPVELTRLGGGFSLETPRIAQTARQVDLDIQEEERPKTSRVRNNSEKRFKNKPLTARQKADIAEQRINYPYETQSSARRRSESETRTLGSENSNFGRRKDPETDSMTVMSSRRQSELSSGRKSDFNDQNYSKRQKSDNVQFSLSISSSRRSNLDESPLSSRRSNFDEAPLSARRQKSGLEDSQKSDNNQFSIPINSAPRSILEDVTLSSRRQKSGLDDNQKSPKSEITPLNIPSFSSRKSALEETPTSARRQKTTLEEPTTARRQNTDFSARSKNNSSIRNKNEDQNEKIRRNLESLPFSSRRTSSSSQSEPKIEEKPQTARRAPSDYDHLNLPMSSRRQSELGRNTEIDPISIETTDSHYSTPMNSSRRPPSARRIEKNSAAEHLWAPQIVHEQKEIDEIPELTITSARRQKAEKLKRRPMKTAKRPN